MGTSLAPLPVAAESGRGGDASLIYSFGAGWLPPPNGDLPAAFRSLAELLIFWEVTAQSARGLSGTPYSINGVPVHEAICVKLMRSGLSQGWLLFMAPWAAHLGWYYMMSYLKATPGIQTGPVVTGLKVNKYVTIKCKGNISESGWWTCDSSPDMNKLTVL